MQRFELLGRNGAGANSTVFKCRDTASGAIVAVKKLEGSTVPQILQEAAIMRACAHENCVTLLEAHQGLTSGVIYLVMEHAEHSLSRELLLNPRGLPLPKAKLVIFQLASALELIHGKKVVHGDIKPANVLLTAQCNSKLCDFGSATSVVLSGGDDSTQALRTDEVCIIPGHASPEPAPSAFANTVDSMPKVTAAASRWYCAPESLLGAPGSAASDIWALGCILGELVTGKPLMAGGQNELDQLSCVVAMIGQLSRAQEKLLQLLPRQQRAKLEEARARGPLLDRISKVAACPALAEVLRACLHPDPGCRPTAKELQAMPLFEDLRQAQLARQAAEAAAVAAAAAMRLQAATAAAAIDATDDDFKPWLSSSGSMDLDPQAVIPASPPDDTSPCSAAVVASEAQGTATMAASTCVPPVPRVSEAPAVQPPRRISGVQAAAPVRPLSRARVSALTATIRGNPFEGDGGYIDLMPQVLRLAAKLDEAHEREVLGPIALAARRCSTSPLASPQSAPSGELPTLGARLPSGGIAAALAATLTTPEPIKVEAVCMTPIAAAAGGCGAVRSTTAVAPPATAVAASSLSPMDCSPAAPAPAAESGAAAAVVTKRSPATKPSTPLSASVGAVPYIVKAAGLASCAAARGGTPVAAATKATPAHHLRSRVIINRARRHHGSREPRAGSVPMTFLDNSSAVGSLGASATIMQRELAAAALPPSIIVAPSGVARHAGLQRSTCHAAQRSFADLSDLTSVAEYQAEHYETPPELKRRRGPRFSSQGLHPVPSSQLSTSSLGSLAAEVLLGSTQEREPSLCGRTAHATATGASTGLLRRLRRTSSGTGLAVSSPARGAIGWMQLLQAGMHEASLPQPIQRRSRSRGGGGAAAPAHGLAASISSDVHNSAASDAFLREVV